MNPSKHIYTTIIMLLPVLLLFSACSAREIVAPNPVSGATSDESFNLLPFRPIPGTEYLMAHVATEKPSNASYNRTIYSSYEIRNVIFLNSESLASSRLFDTNVIVILDVTLPPSLHQGSSMQVTERTAFADSGEEPIRWLIYQLAKEDTNEDGILDKRDLITIAVSDVDGQNYTEMLDNISTINSMNMVDKEKLLIVYTQDGSRKATILNLQERLVAETRPLIDIDASYD